MKPAEALQANQEKHWFCVTRAFLVQSPSLWSLRSATFLMKQRRNQEQAQDVPHAPAPEWGGTDTAVSAAQEQHRIIPKHIPLVLFSRSSHCAFPCLPRLSIIKFLLLCPQQQLRERSAHYTQEKLQSAPAHRLH